MFVTYVMYDMILKDIFSSSLDTANKKQDPYLFFSLTYLCKGQEMQTEYGYV